MNREEYNKINLEEIIVEMRLNGYSDEEIFDELVSSEVVSDLNQEEFAALAERLVG